MVKKLQKLSNDKKMPGAQLSSTVKDSAQQIWLAGLGAFAKAQEEGNKVFEALVKEGLSLQRKTQAVAEEKISQASSRVTGMASDIGSRAAGQWDKLETIFEDRVATALSKLGVPTSRDLDVLNARIDALAKSLGKTPPVTKPAPTKKAAAKPAAKKAVTKPAAKKVAAKPAAKPAAKKAPAKRAPFPKVAPRGTAEAAAAADASTSA
jgi:poly(hydroxyalkanoate) granule-associated protein